MYSSLMEQRSVTMSKVAKYRWPDGIPIAQQTLFDAGDVRHVCEFIIPAGHKRMCYVCDACESPDIEMDSALIFQPPPVDQNSATIAKHHRSFCSIGDDFTIGMDGHTLINIPTNRAEWRRRSKHVKKHPNVEPVLLKRCTFKVGPGQSHQGHMSVTFDKPLKGPGILVWAIRRVDMPSIKKLKE